MSYVGARVNSNIQIGRAFMEKMACVTRVTLKDSVVLLRIPLFHSSGGMCKEERFAIAAGNFTVV